MSKLESICLYYRIKNEVPWLAKNLDAYRKANEMLENAYSASISSYVTTSYGPPRVEFIIKCTGDEIEKVLDTLFSSDCGLPDVILKPMSTKEGFEIAEKTLRKYGKTLKTQYWPPPVVEKRVI